MLKSTHLLIGGLLAAGMLAACEQNNNFTPDTAWGATAKEAEIEETAAQKALRRDARFAQTMPLKHFARYMKTRLPYYKQFKTVDYQDGYVKIRLEGGKVKIETPKGKVKFELSDEEIANI